MEIEFKLEREDLVDLNLHVIVTQPGRRTIIRIGVLIIATAMFASPFLFDRGRGGPVLCAVSASLLLLILLLNTHKALRAQARRSVVQTESTGAYKRLYDLTRLRLDPEGLVRTDSLNVSAWKWPAIERIDVTDGLILFCLGPKYFVVVPRRAFADEAALNEFVETACRYHREALERAGESKNAPAGQEPRSGGMQ